MGSFAAASLNQMLDAYVGRTTYTANAAFYVKLHIGDPGAAGANNAAANTTRQQATFGTGAAAGAIANTVAVTWTNVPNAETYSHVSFWTASSGGTYLGNDDLSATAVMQVGDTFTIAIGALTLTLT